MEVAMGDSVYIRPCDDVLGHGQGYFRQEVGVELALAVDRDHVCVLYLEYYTEYSACGSEV